MAGQITPGPWEVVEHRTSLGIRSVPAQRSVANVALGWVERSTHNDPQRRADAHAIAALPVIVEAMLGAIKSVRPLERQGEDRVWRAAERARVQLEDALKAAGIMA